MKSVEGARMFNTTGVAYDAFMGRYSNSLAAAFVSQLSAERGQKALDVGCGPGALTQALAYILGAEAVSACDPGHAFVDECARRNPGVDVRRARGEDLPFSDDEFDLVAAQLVLHFVTDAHAVMSEFRRVSRPGGVIGACVWDFEEGMEMLRAFWDAALELDPGAPDEARTLRFGGSGEMVRLFDDAGLTNIAETTLTVSSTYESFDELWNGFRAGIGPAGAYCTSLTSEQQAELRRRLSSKLGEPTGTFMLSAVARTVTGIRPG